MVDTTILRGVMGPGEVQRLHRRVGYATSLGICGLAK